MDDKFLYQNRPPLRPGFGENLYTRLSKDAQAGKGWLDMSKYIWRFGLACLLAAGVLLAFFQPVRAAVVEWIKQVAGFEISEADSLPAVDESIVIPPDAQGSLERILETLPYELSLPAYVTRGFVFEDKVDVQDTSVFLRWLNADGDEILLLVDTDRGQHYVTGTDAAQEVTVNGAPAMLVQGGYGKDNAWDPSLKMMNLVQRRGDLIYWLVYIQDSDGEFDNVIIQGELALMMGSIP